MRGWKVSLSDDLASAAVGKTRGPALELTGLGWAESDRSDLRVYLVDELPEHWSEDHEKALVDGLNKERGGEWVLLTTELLHPRWSQLTNTERRRLLLREGFESLV